MLATLLPLPAFARAVAIMALDEVLDRLEGYRGDARNRGDYWVTVFGSPGSDLWAVRFEGHHLSVHATLSPDESRITPLFLGANPSVVSDGGRAVVAPLAPEEDLGFELLHALSSEQRGAAVISDEAPRDILTRNSPDLGGSPLGMASQGIPLAALQGPAAAAAEALVLLYLGRFVPGTLRPDPERASFAWAGSDEPGKGHYYRIAGPRLLIELDNTQNGANHVHTVVRNPLTDFGDDLLATHLQLEHGSH